MWSPFKAEGKGSSGRGSAVDRVLNLSSQGMSEQQIIQTLRSEGYRPADVDAALRDALRSSVTSPQNMSRPPQRNMQRQPDFMNMDTESYGSDFDTRGEPPMPDREQDDLRMPEMPRREFGMNDMDDDVDSPPRDLPRFEEREPMPRLETGRRSVRRDRRRRDMEEMAEGIADDKWTDFEAEAGDIRHEIKDISERVVVLERTMRKLQGEKSTELEGIQEMINSYKQTITGMGERMEGMEKALKDSLTPMMETLRALSDTVRSLKEKK